MYEIDVDRGSRLVRVRIVGLQDADEVASYEKELKWHILNVTSSERGFSLLVDLRDSQVIPQQNTRQLQERMQWYVENGLRKSALVITSMLMQIQTKRLAPDARFKYFLSEQDAMAWLRSDEDSAHG